MYDKRMTGQIEKRKEYVSYKEKIRAMHAFMKEMQNQRETIEDIISNYNREESHNCDIMIPNFTIYIENIN